MLDETSLIESLGDCIELMSELRAERCPGLAMGYLQNPEIHLLEYILYSDRVCVALEPWKYCSVLYLPCPSSARDRRYWTEPADCRRAGRDNRQGSSALGSTQHIGILSTITLT